MRKLRRIERKNHEAESVDSEGSWAISYGDMITLLLSFFVLYFTVDHNKERANQLHESLLVRLEQEGMKLNENGEKYQLNIGTQPGESVDVLVLKKLGGEIYEVGQTVMVDFKNISFFDIGEVDLTVPGIQALGGFARIYLPFAGQYQLSIQAYTDTRKVRSHVQRYKDNLELSALRSIAAMRVLQKAGLPLTNMKIGGYGELVEAQAKLMKLQNEKDPLKYTRKVVLSIEPKRERN